MDLSANSKCCVAEEKTGKKISHLTHFFTLSNNKPSHHHIIYTKRNHHITMFSWNGIGSNDSKKNEEEKNEEDSGSNAVFGNAFYLSGTDDSGSDKEMLKDKITADLESVDVVIIEETPEKKVEVKEKKTFWTNRRNRPAREYSPQEIRNRRIAIGVFVFVVLVTGIIVLVRSLNKLDSTEYGVQYNSHSKQLDEAAKTGGLHAGPPGYEFIKYPSTYIGVDQSGICVTLDGLRVAFSVTFQYIIRPENLVPVVLKYRDFDRWADIVEAAGLSAVQHTCSDFIVSNFQNKRGIIQAAMEENLRMKLGGDSENDKDFGVYAEAISLQLSNVDLPSEYQYAIAEKQSAEEDITLAQNQRKQETTKAQTGLLTAKEEARKILDTANNEAAVILTEARLKAEETTFAFLKEAETIVAVRESLNLTTEGVLAFLTNQLLEGVANLRVSTGEPARLSRKEEL
jgi:hypothetical protein